MEEKALAEFLEECGLEDDVEVEDLLRNGVNSSNDLEVAKDAVLAMFLSSSEIRMIRGCLAKRRNLREYLYRKGWLKRFPEVFVVLCRMKLYDAKSISQCDEKRLGEGLKDCGVGEAFHRIMQDSAEADVRDRNNNRRETEYTGRERWRGERSNERTRGGNRSMERSRGGSLERTKRGGRSMERTKGGNRSMERTRGGSRSNELLGVSERKREGSLERSGGGNRSMERSRGGSLERSPRGDRSMERSRGGSMERTKRGSRNNERTREGNRSMERTRGGSRSNERTQVIKKRTGLEDTVRSPHAIPKVEGGSVQRNDDSSSSYMEDSSDSNSFKENNNNRTLWEKNYSSDSDDYGQSDSDCEDGNGAVENPLGESSKEKRKSEPTFLVKYDDTGNVEMEEEDSSFSQQEQIPCCASDDDLHISYDGGGSPGHQGKENSSEEMGEKGMSYLLESSSDDGRDKPVSKLSGTFSFVKHYDVEREREFEIDLELKKVPCWNGGRGSISPNRKMVADFGELPSDVSEESLMEDVVKRLRKFAGNRKLDFKHGSQTETDFAYCSHLIAKHDLSKLYDVLLRLDPSELSKSEAGQFFVVVLLTFYGKGSQYDYRDYSSALKAFVNGVTDVFKGANLGGSEELLLGNALFLLGHKGKKLKDDFASRMWCLRIFEKSGHPNLHKKCLVLCNRSYHEARTHLGDQFLNGAYEELFEFHRKLKRSMHQQKNKQEREELKRVIETNISENLWKAQIVANLIGQCECEEVLLRIRSDFVGILKQINVALRALNKDSELRVQSKKRIEHLINQFSSQQYEKDFLEVEDELFIPKLQHKLHRVRAAGKNCQDFSRLLMELFQEAIDNVWRVLEEGCFYDPHVVKFRLIITGSLAYECCSYFSDIDYALVSRKKPLSPIDEMFLILFKGIVELEFMAFGEQGPSFGSCVFEDGFQMETHQQDIDVDQRDIALRQEPVIVDSDVVRSVLDPIQMNGFAFGKTVGSGETAAMLAEGEVRKLHENCNNLLGSSFLDLALDGHDPSKYMNDVVISSVKMAFLRLPTYAIFALAIQSNKKTTVSCWELVRLLQGEDSLSQEWAEALVFMLEAGAYLRSKAQRVYEAAADAAECTPGLERILLQFLTPLYHTLAEFKLDPGSKSFANNAILREYELEFWFFKEFSLHQPLRRKSRFARLVKQEVLKKEQEKMTLQDEMANEQLELMSGATIGELTKRVGYLDTNPRSKKVEALKFAIRMAKEGGLQTDSGVIRKGAVVLTGVLAGVCYTSSFDSVFSDGDNPNVAVRESRKPGKEHCVYMLHELCLGGGVRRNEVVARKKNGEIDKVWLVYPPVEGTSIAQKDSLNLRTNKASVALFNLILFSLAVGSAGVSPDNVMVEEETSNVFVLDNSRAFAGVFDSPILLLGEMKMLIPEKTRVFFTELDIDQKLKCWSRSVDRWNRACGMQFEEEELDRVAEDLGVEMRFRPTAKMLADLRNALFRIQRMCSLRRKLTPLNILFVLDNWAGENAFGVLQICETVKERWESSDVAVNKDGRGKRQAGEMCVEKMMVKVLQSPSNTVEEALLEKGREVENRDVVRSLQLRDREWPKNNKKVGMLACIFSCPNLVLLDISGCKAFHDEYLGELAQLLHLRTLIMRDVEGLENFQTGAETPGSAVKRTFRKIMNSNNNMLTFAKLRWLDVTACKNLKLIDVSIASNCDSVYVSDYTFKKLCPSGVPNMVIFGEHHSIHLEGFNMDEHVCRLFANTLERNSYLFRINLSGCGIVDSTIAIIAKAISKTPAVGMQVMLKGNWISEKGCVQLEEAIRSNPKCIHKLDLRNNGLNEESIPKGFRKALRQKKDAPLIVLISKV